LDMLSSHFTRHDLVEDCNGLPSRSVRLNSESTNCDVSQCSDSDWRDLPAGKAAGGRAVADAASVDDVTVEIVESGFRRFSISDVENCNDIAALAALAAQAQASPDHEQAADIELLDADYQRFCKREIFNDITALDISLDISSTDASFQRFEQAESCNQCTC